eukprot:7679508-Pyramimonas_sp.AAC.1
MSDVLVPFVRSICLRHDTPVGPHKAVVLRMSGVGSHNFIYIRIQPEAFRLPNMREAFVPGDISGWPGFEIFAGESVGILARRWFSSAELYLCMYMGLPEFDRPRYSGRAAGCRLE